MNSIRSIVFFLLLAVSWNAWSDDLPDRPNPPRLVNDLASIFSPEQRAALEQKLIAYNDSTSTQIAVITISDLKGYDIGDFAQRLGQKWGVGQAKNNNGLMMVIKPKLSANDKGGAWISTGYGMEEKIPDITARRIINQIMIPEFQQGDMYAGVDQAVDVIIGLCSGTYQADSLEKKDNGDLAALLVPLILFIIILFSFRKNKYRQFDGSSSSSGSRPIFMPGGFLNSGGGGRSSSGGFGSFGGGSFGGGGFGGFGGGSFGGGGAGGSW